MGMKESDDKVQSNKHRVQNQLLRVNPKCLSCSPDTGVNIYIYIYKSPINISLYYQVLRWLA